MPDLFVPQHQQKIPGLMGLYSKAVLRQLQRRRNNVQQLPDLQIQSDAVQLNARHIESYKKICGFSAQDERLPATYLHNLAFRLQMALMTDPRWPLPVMGTVHLRNHIVQFAAPGTGPLTLRCKLDAYTFTHKGCEFSLCTEAFSQGNLVWQDISRFMQLRSPHPHKNTPRPAVQHLPHRQHWQLSADTGRRFARISGDANPIHLGFIGARLFGFKRAIAHGMFSKARCLAALLPQLAGESYALTVDFKKPVYLPAALDFEYIQQNGEFKFQLLNQHGEMCLEGKLHSLNGFNLHL